MTKFSVVYCLDEKYLIPFCCSLSSLLEHNNHLTDEVFVLHDEQSANSSEFEQIKTFIRAKYEKEICDFVVEPSVFKDLRVDLHVSHATYFRFLIAEKLPSHVQAVLSIDCDTIVRKELDVLPSISFDNEKELFAYAVDHEFHEIPSRLKKYYLPLNSYFNAGVLFMNLTKIRNEQDSNSLIKFGLENKAYLRFWDQDILNIHFQNKWGRLPPEYNVFEKNTNKISDPIVIHYTGNRKPWSLYCDNPYRERYWDVLRRTPFYSINYRMLNWFSATISALLKPFLA